MTPQEVADFLRISVLTVYKHINAGTLPAFRVGRQYRIEYPELKSYVEAHRVGRTS
jgi:putative molybdopterin biosynthesis protein